MDDSRKKSILLMCAVTGLLLAGGIYVFAGRGATDDGASDADQSTVVLKCAACQATSDMPLAEYQKRVGQRSDPAAKLACPQCGAAQAWKLNEGRAALPAPSARDQAEALDSRKEGDYQAPPPTGSEPQPRKSSFTPARRPRS